MNAEKLFGVPAMSFDDTAAAIAWVRDSVLAPRQFSMDVKAARQFLEIG